MAEKASTLSTAQTENGSDCIVLQEIKWTNKAQKT